LETLYPLNVISFPFFCYLIFSLWNFGFAHYAWLNSTTILFFQVFCTNQLHPLLCMNQIFLKFKYTFEKLFHFFLLCFSLNWLEYDPNLVSPQKKVKYKRRCELMLVKLATSRVGPFDRLFVFRKITSHFSCALCKPLPWGIAVSPQRMVMTLTIFA